MYLQNKTFLKRNVIYGITLFLVFLSAFGEGNLPNARAQAWTSTHQITYFQGNKAGAVSFTFDDGYTSQVTSVVNELNTRGLKGTFFIITGSDWINGHVPWAGWQNLVTQGHEVAAHTVTHQDLTTLAEGEMRWEMTESQATIMQNVPGQACASLSYPNTASNSTVQAAASDYFVAARGGFLGDGYLNYYQSGSDQSGSWAAMNFYNIGSRSSDGLIPSTDQYFNSLLNTAAARHAWFSLHFHTINAGSFAMILDYIQEKPEYWIDTFCNISRYMKERLNSTIQVITDTPSEIRLNVIMNPSLSTSIYNYPLTIRSTIPASWTQVIVQQGSSVQTLTPFLEGNENVVYYNAVPNGGELSLAASIPTATNTSIYTPTSTPIYTATTTPTITPSAIFTLTPASTPTATAVALPWHAPSASTAVTAVSNPNNAFTSNNAYATFNANGNNVTYTTFGIPVIPALATINGIEVSVEGYNGQAGGRNLQVQMSWNGGTNFTTVTAARTTSLPITDGIVILGGPVDTWGRTWSTTEFTNVNFTIKTTSTGGPVPPVNLDQLRVRVYYTIAENTPTTTMTFMPTNTLTSVPTSTQTNMPTATATNTSTHTATNTFTPTPMSTPTPTQTNIPTFTSTTTPTRTPTVTPTDTLTYTPAYTATNTSTTVPTSAPTFTETNTPTVTPTNTLTHTPAYTATNTSTDTPTNPTNTPTATQTSTPTNLPTNTATPTNTLPPPTATNTPLPGPANTGFLNPSANAAQIGGDWNGYQTDSTNAYTNNSVFAVDTNSGTNSSSSCTDGGKDKHRFYNYGFSIPGTQVLGIEVKMDAKADSTSGAPKLCIQLSWNGGSSWTTAKQTGTLTTTEQTYILGSPTDNWGHTWTLSQLSNSNFRVRIIDVATSTSRDFSLDWITVRVTYQ